MKDTRQILLETLLDPSSSESDKQAASEAISKLDTPSKPVKPSPTEATSTSDKYFRDFELTNRAHLIEEAKYPEPIAVLKKCGQQLFSAASDYVWKENPTTAQGDRDRLILPTLISWMNFPDSAPPEVRDYIKWGKAARRHLTSVGITWAVGFLDWPFGDDDPHCPYRQFEDSWYAEPEQEKE